MEAAERLKISAENLNSMLTTSLQKISDTRKRTRKLKAVSILRKKRKKNVSVKNANVKNTLIKEQDHIMIIKNKNK